MRERREAAAGRPEHRPALAFLVGVQAGRPNKPDGGALQSGYAQRLVDGAVRQDHVTIGATDRNSRHLSAHRDRQLRGHQPGEAGDPRAPRQQCLPKSIGCRPDCGYRTTTRDNHAVGGFHATWRTRVT